MASPWKSETPDLRFPRLTDQAFGRAFGRFYRQNKGQPRAPWWFHGKAPALRILAHSRRAANYKSEPNAQKARRESSRKLATLSQCAKSAGDVKL
jgi:hypothetical protein